MRCRVAILCVHLLMCVGAVAVPAHAALDETLGGDGSVVARGPDAYSHVMRNATKVHRRSFVVGNALFKENWVSTPSSVKSRQGLGPLINAQSCSTCHFKDGRGRPPEEAGGAFASMLVRFSIPGVGPHGGVNPVPHYGDQLQHRSILGVKAEGDVSVSYEEIKGAYADGTPYVLTKPHYVFANLTYGPLPADLMISPRTAPAMIGLGLLEAIDEAKILAHADPEDKDGDGISGRPNLPWDVAASKHRLGRFGWKANQPSLAQQDAGAFLGDMGLTSRYFPTQNCGDLGADCSAAPKGEGVEVSDDDLRDVTTYSRLLAVPLRRDAKEPTVLAGEKVFNDLHCQSCHVTRYETGNLPGFPELSRQLISPFTDLLLHDMGDDLADGRPDFAANGNEWRTAPLWGVGLLREASGHTRLLHDGRARNLEEAILWHGGEALAPRKGFEAASKQDREVLIRFLESL